MENNINKTRETIICINNKENKFLSQDLKNQEEELRISDKIAKGVIKINIFIITYLNEYVNTKFSKDIEREALIMPSKEKTSIDVVPTEIVELISKINSAKQIFLLNNSSPISLIERVIIEIKFKNCSIKKYEKLIQIPKIIALNINCNGFSIGE